jgi:hypothetical protein
MAAKFFTGLPLDGPDPECVLGHGEAALAARGADAELPKSAVDHSKRRVTRVRPCNDDPVAELVALAASTPES